MKWISLHISIAKNSSFKFEWAFVQNAQFSILSQKRSDKKAAQKEVFSSILINITESSQIWFWMGSSKISGIHLLRLMHLIWSLLTHTPRKSRKQATGKRKEAFLRVFLHPRTRSTATRASASRKLSRLEFGHLRSLANLPAEQRALLLGRR